MTNASNAYRDFNGKWDGTVGHAEQLLAEFVAEDLLDGATEAYYAEGLDRDGGELDEDAAQVLNVLLALGYSH